MSIKVLIVDDMKTVRQMIKTNLKIAGGYEIHEAVNGQEALDVAREVKPDVMLLDIMMPVMDGLEACERLREDPAISAIYVIMLTAKAKVEDRVEGLDIGADDYIAKPFDPDELMARIRRGHKIAQDRQNALYDALTGLYNRRSFDSFFAKELSRVRRYGGDLCMVLVDIDHFKVVNDTHGHAAGDVVLQELANLLLQNSRESDLPCRWGGEEFALLMPETSIEAATTKAESIRQAVEAFEFTAAGRLTASFGVSRPGPEEHSMDFFRRVDEALYQAKEGGRNKVVSIDFGE